MVTHVVAQVAVERRDKAWLLPAAAVLKEKGGASVFKHVDGKAVKTAVKLGFEDGVMAELESASADEVFVLIPAGGLVDGQAVTLGAVN
jgi:hypothetical protein